MTAKGLIGETAGDAVNNSAKVSHPLYFREIAEMPVRCNGYKINQTF
jgi:hypothetical protein